MDFIVYVDLLRVVVQPLFTQNKYTSIFVTFADALNALHLINWTEILKLFY